MLSIKLKRLIKEQIKDKWLKKVIPFIINPIKKMTNYGLTLKQRGILALKLCGFSYEEISQLLNISISNVKSTISQIRRKLGLPENPKF